MPLADKITIWFIILAIMFVSLYLKKTLVLSFLEKLHIIRFIEKLLYDRLFLTAFAIIFLGIILGISLRTHFTFIIEKISIPFNPNSKDETSIIVNLATEIIGIGLTYFLIQIYIDNQTKKNRIQKQKVAIEKLRLAIQEHNFFLFQIFKFSVRRGFDYKNDPFFQNEINGSATELYNKNLLENPLYIDNVRKLDFESDYSSDIKWSLYFKFKFIEFKNTVNSIFDRYNDYLEITPKRGQRVPQIKIFENFLDVKFISETVFFININVKFNKVVDSFEEYIETFLSNCNYIKDYENEHPELYNNENEIDTNKISRLSLNILNSIAWENEIENIGKARNDIDN